MAEDPEWIRCQDFGPAGRPLPSDRSTDPAHFAEAGLNDPQRRAGQSRKRCRKPTTLVVEFWAVHDSVFETGKGFRGKVGSKPQARMLWWSAVHDAFSVICSTNACRCSPGRNLKNRETECKSVSGSPWSRFAPARKSAQIISKQCGRSPDHKAKRDGQFELEQYTCKLPAVDPATTARLPVKVSDYGLPLLVVLRVTFHFTQPLMNCGVN